MNPNTIIFSVPTSGGGATPAATYSFMSRGYKQPHQGRASGMDTIGNQNGSFRYIYDNGPGPYDWEPFELVLSDRFAGVAGGMATQQAANFLFLWSYTGPMGMRVPGGTYTVAWQPGMDLQREWLSFPTDVGDVRHTFESSVAIAIVEGG